ncbi:hypothetical protein ACFOZ5_13615 [Marinobacter lacisalsi]|uniref:Uncharacterized protein n=1 Tax=Marinobacter lacisalsi TaxID=475979 RepID=A0ABV8QKH9_9GAMM
MTSAIYYPRSATSPQVIAENTCPSDMTSEEFAREFMGANWKDSQPSVCQPNRAVAIPSGRPNESVDISPILSCSMEEQRTLAHLSQYAGGAAVMGMADFLFETKIPSIVGDLNTFGGNGMGAALAQSDTVLKAIDKYDVANKRYEDLKNHRAAPRMVDGAKRRAEAAFKEMNQVLFSRSKNYLNNNTFRMRQTTNATGRTVWESIPVRDAADVQKLTKFAKIGRVAGPGFIMVDGYLRTNGVYQSWKNGENWERKAVVEGGSFLVGIGAGVLIGAVIAVTPVGLAVGIVAGGAAAVGADYAFKDIIGWLYDLVD